MDNSELAEYAYSDPVLEQEEKEFTVSFVKAGEKRASFSTSIKGPMRRAIRHTDMDVEEIQVYYESDETHENMPAEAFDGDGKIVSIKGTCPIGLLKLGSNPRKSGGYANIISDQSQVNIE